MPRDNGDEKDKSLCKYGLQFLRMFSGETIRHTDGQATRFLRPWDTRDLGDLQAFATVLAIVTLARGFQFGLNVSLDSETDEKVVLKPACSAALLCLIPVLGSAVADEWPQWRGPTRDGVWPETGIVEQFAARDSRSAGARRSAAATAARRSPSGRVYVTDRQTEPEQVERVHCLDWQTGRRLWTYTYACPYESVGYTAGPRAAVSIDDGRAYALGTMGHLHCLDAATGTLLWKKEPGSGLQGPRADLGHCRRAAGRWRLVIVQTRRRDGACLVALDKRTGAEKWRALDDPASYSAPIIIQQAGRRVLVCWTGANVAGLDPASGEVYWKYPFPPTRMVINVPTPVVDGDRLFLTAFYDGSLMLELRQDELRVEKLWRRHGASERQTDALHAMISTPYLEGDYVYGVDSYGELRCLDARTGDRIWEDLTAVAQGPLGHDPHGPQRRRGCGCSTSGAN